MSVVSQQLDTPTYRPEGFNDIDTSGMYTTRSRKGTEIVVYFYGQKKPDIIKFNTTLQTIVKKNPKLLRLLNCKRPPPITARILLVNCLGITSNVIKAAVSSDSIQASNITFIPKPHLRNQVTVTNPIITSEKCYVTLSFPSGTNIPPSFTAPTILGPDKTMTVENLLEFSKELVKIPPSNYRTAFCTHFASKKKCYHGNQCNFAHSAEEH